MRAAQRLFALHRRSEHTGVPVPELAGRARRARAAQEAGLTRRETLARGIGVAAGATLAGRTLAGAARAAGATRARAGAVRVAVIGGGLAGLRCAHLLSQSGAASRLAVTVYEANGERSGGRCWTLRDYFEDGLLTEHGGSFLNSNQHAVRRLAAELGLREEVVGGGDLPAGEEVFFAGGAIYTLAQAEADWRDFGFAAFRRAGRESQREAGAARLDAMSVPEWLDSTPIGTGSRFGQLMLSNTVTENGGDPADQSALDLIELLAGNPRSALQPLPGDDERFHIVGGNDQLVSGMIARLPAGTVRNGHVLSALRSGPGGVRLAFEVAGATREAGADIVVLALPFSTLRDVDLSRSGLTAQKQQVIATMGMGTNAKVHLELTHKTWPALGFSGATYGEWGRIACAWDDCVQLGAGAEPALFVAFPGADAGRSGLTGAAHGPAPAADVAFALGDIERVFPGTTAAFTGRAYEDHWALDPWVKGAYSYYRVGQATSYGQLAARPEWPFLFAGEHTSIANIGFLDGAVETGERAARALLRRLR